MSSNETNMIGTGRAVIGWGGPPRPAAMARVNRDRCVRAIARQEADLQKVLAAKYQAWRDACYAHECREYNRLTGYTGE